MRAEAPPPPHPPSGVHRIFVQNSLYEKASRSTDYTKAISVVQMLGVVASLLVFYGSLPGWALKMN
jgi:hypothetical protein